MSKEQMVTSTGSIGSIEKRSYGRIYLSDEHCYDNYGDFLQRWEQLIEEGNNLSENKNDRRRFVLRTFVTKSVLSEIEQYLNSGNENQPKIEALYSQGEFGGNEDEFMILIGANFHRSNIRLAEETRLKSIEQATTPDSIDNTLIVDRVQSLPKNYSLTYSVTDDDAEDLAALWGHNFEWTEDGIKAFTNTQGNGNLWFTGVRDSNGILVAASMAEAVVFRDRWFTELTEWASTVRGVSSTMIMGLISRVLDNLYYGSKNLPPVLLAEMNLHHQNKNNMGAPGTGISSGLRLPDMKGSKNFNTLRHNVLVGDGRLDSGYENLNNFAFGILSLEMIKAMYPETAVKKVVELVEGN